MNSDTNGADELLASLRERAKELSCLYKVEEILMSDRSLEERLQLAADMIPSGWFRPEDCRARIVYRGISFESPGFRECGDCLQEPLIVQGNRIGDLSVCYPEQHPDLEEGAFLPEERRLIATLSQRIAQAVFHEKLTQVFHVGEDSLSRLPGTEKWRSILEMLAMTNRKLYTTLCRRMLNYLSFIGVAEATGILERWVGRRSTSLDELDHEGINQPIRKHAFEISPDLVSEIFSIASSTLRDEQIFALLQRWVGENRIDYLIDVLDDHSSSLRDICQALERFKDIGLQESGLSPIAINAVKVSLIRRFVSRRLDFISRAKELTTLEDFYELSRILIFPSGSHGQLGGKSAGLLLARIALRNASRDDEELGGIRIPRTWYITSDGILDFVHYNHLEELLEYRYRDISEIRLEYPNLVQLFKNSAFSPEMVRGISVALDDLGDRPLIVRSSSLLEDSSEAAFSGKHKSLFLANKGSKQERIEAMLDAIAEVYASMFGPDPIEYRAERGLLDFQEEMGILIQEVVGVEIGPFFFPAYSGVAFSHNEFRWSPRIDRDDGLIRLVPGLGTRAVDRVSDDYPILVAPGQPGLRVNASLDETIRYSPKYMDVINLETRSVETIPIRQVVETYGSDYPRANLVFSLGSDGFLRDISALTDLRKEFAVVTFEKLIGRGSSFIDMMKRLLDVLENHCGFPVDIEFAADIEHLYLLQCRAQVSRTEEESVRLPERPVQEDLIFTAEKYVSDGLLPSISHVVYISPEAYDSLEDLHDLREVGRIVGRLNNILPKRRFILMGPGRWGSRGDVKLGVSVTYSDINNTAALIEMAFRKGNYVPDLSFGTHFFQDLVEASIRYLPLYPDDHGIFFKRDFFEDSENMLSRYLPDEADFSRVVRVLDIPGLTGGRVLRLVMSGQEGKAFAFLAEDSYPPGQTSMLQERKHPPARKTGEGQWLWRQKMAESMAQSIDPEALGVVGMYLFGSVKHANAGPCSDIDIIVHFRGTDLQRELLLEYLDGWSNCLGEANFVRTGFRTGPLLDVHLVTDEDIARKKSYAAHIDSVTDPARPLMLGRKDVDPNREG
jgi:pyruvate,water dikinase